MHGDTATMMRFSLLLLLACFVLVLMTAGEADAKPKWSYTAEGWRVNSVSISADGEYIATGSEDYGVYLFDKDSSTPLWSYETGMPVLSVAISADGEYIAAGSEHDGNVYLFDKDSSTPLLNYSTGDSVFSVDISADGEYIVAGSTDGKVYLFNKDSGTLLWNYSTGVNVWSVAISADGDYIVAGSDDDKVYLFGKDSSTPLWNYTVGDRVNTVSISADGEYVVAGSNDNSVYLFDKDSGTLLWSYSTGGIVNSVAISADGEYITAGSESNKVYLFGKDSSTPLWSYTTAGNAVNSVAISADGEYIMSGSDDHRVYLFDKYSSTALWSYSTGDWDASVLTVDISADGEYTVAGSESNTVYLFYNNLPPTATIDSITPSSARFDAEVTFSGSGSDSDGTVVAYQWESSIDGELSTEANFSITGLSIGYHSISFRVQDNDGEWSEWENTTLVIYPNAPPVATIDSITPSSARFDAEVTFSGSGSDSDGTIVAYEWSCDIDGFLSDEVDFSITGFSVGTHTISLRVQDNDGGWSEWDTAELVIYPNTPPVGTIDSISPSPAKFDEEVTFSGSGSDGDGTVVAYLWESSIDGELSTDEDFSSSDLSLGHHTITFRVQDNDGVWSDSPTSGGNGSVPGIQLWIYAVPVAIAGQDSTGTPGVPLQFSGAGTDEDGTIAKYEWDFDGDGVFEWSSTENGRELNIYNNEETYTATLRVTDNDGFTDTDTVEVTISEKKIQIDDEGNVTVTDAEEDEEGIPTLSVITTMAAVAVMALRRRSE
jgi:WD40 repeat protein